MGSHCQVPPRVDGERSLKIIIFLGRHVVVYEDRRSQSNLNAVLGIDEQERTRAAHLDEVAYFQQLSFLQPYYDHLQVSIAGLVVDQDIPSPKHDVHQVLGCVEVGVQLELRQFPKITWVGTLARIW